MYSWINSHTNKFCMQTNYSCRNGEIFRTQFLYSFMEHIKKSHLEDCWSSDSVELLLRFWHFRNNEDTKGIGCIGCKRFVMLSWINLKNYTLGRELSIDGSIILWRGNFSFHQYIPIKWHKYVKKLHALWAKWLCMECILWYDGFHVWIRSRGKHRNNCDQEMSKQRTFTIIHEYSSRK